ncbi:hypothetical protein LCGC14_1529600 [marine sediment metagenome]|uniref:Uncharacterized protein n=1 Tax=marine sediment metagenome TaxID=412755 RepID=A0A0F9LX62_9ZZZZ|nr:hypothetical protein [archaeon]
MVRGIIIKICKTYEIEGIFKIIQNDFNGFIEWMVYLYPSYESDFYDDKLYGWKSEEIKSKRWTWYRVVNLESINDRKTIFRNNPCKMLSCEGCESDMGKKMPCFTPDHGIFPKKLDGLDIFIKNKEKFLFRKKKYYLRLGNEKNQTFLGISSEDSYKNYIRLQIGFKESNIINENFLRNKFHKIIWKLTGFICRFRGKIKDRYFIYDNSICAWSQKIIIDGPRHWFGYELAIKNYLKEKGYKYKYQHGIVKDSFRNKIYPDFIIDPNEKYKGHSFIIEVKFSNFDFEVLLNKESPDIVEKIEFNNDKWRAVEIEGLKSDMEFIYNIIDDNKILRSKYGEFKKILNQVFKYSKLIPFDCGILLSLNSTFNVLYKNKLIKFVETPLYDTSTLKLVGT